jgi:hypothetical protein
MHQSRTILLVAAAAAAAAFTTGASPAHAQRQYGAGVGVAVAPGNLYVGGSLVGTAILNQHGGPELLDDGAGFSLFTGLRVSDPLALELGWTGTLHNPATVWTDFGPDTDYLVLNGLTADAKIYIDTQRPRIEPFVQGGLGLYLLDSQYFGTQSVGSGFQLGGGFDYDAGPSVLLGVRALYRGIAMGPPDATYNDTFVSAVTLEGGITLLF